MGWPRLAISHGNTRFTTPPSPPSPTHIHTYMYLNFIAIMISRAWMHPSMHYTDKTFAYWHKVSYQTNIAVQSESEGSINYHTGSKANLICTQFTHLFIDTDCIIRQISLTSCITHLYFCLGLRVSLQITTYFDPCFWARIQILWKTRSRENKVRYNQCKLFALTINRVKKEKLHGK